MVKRPNSGRQLFFIQIIPAFAINKCRNNLISEISWWAQLASQIYNTWALMSNQRLIHIRQASPRSVSVEEEWTSNETFAVSDASFERDKEEIIY